MLKREKNFRTSWATLAVVGALMSLAGAAIPASFVWLLQLRYSDNPAPWSAVYVWTVLVAVPLAFILEHLTRGTMLQDAASDIDYSSGFEMHVRGRALVGMFILEICLWGPRMVMAGIKRLRRRTAYGHADRDLAARLLATLYQREEGIASGELFVAAEGGASDEAFGDALAYLAFFDWIAIAKNGGRVWLLGSPRKTLDRGR
jgi:hypothetical protein